jgi:hypothetical protein
LRRIDFNFINVFGSAEGGKKIVILYFSVYCMAKKIVYFMHGTMNTKKEFMLVVDVIFE